MFPLPISFYIYAALSLSAIGGVWYGNYEADKYNTYKAGIEAAAKQQEANNKKIVVQQDKVSKRIKDDYETKINDIKRKYANSVFIDTSSGTVSSVPNPTSGANETSPDKLFVEQCAETTQQLEALKQWIIEQGVINAK